jgi:hypothetical protein
MLTMNSINNNVINWITGKKYSKLKKNKDNNDIEYNEVIENFKPESRTQWTSIYSEELVRFLLKKLDYNVRDKKPKINVGKKIFELDIETDKELWEVKSRCWTINGTAGEKILGTPLKYSEIPRITNKQINIVVVAYQEYEADNNFCLFSPKLENRPDQKKIIECVNSLNIKYMRCSDLLYRYLYKKVVEQINALIKD